MQPSSSTSATTASHQPASVKLSSGVAPLRGFDNQYIDSNTEYYLNILAAKDTSSSTNSANVEDRESAGWEQVLDNQRQPENAQQEEAVKNASPRGNFGWGWNESERKRKGERIWFDSDQ